MQKPELLIPAGNLEKLRTAVLYGADAVYVGVEGLSLRAAQAEFGFDDLAQGIREAHQAGVKVYAAMNTFARNRDLPKIKIAAKQVSDLGIDALIVSDPGVLQTIREVSPKLPIHLSTQANTMNAAAVRFWQRQGVERIVLARELNLAETAEIATEVPEVELELFIHGAMCMSYSGRCYLSAHRNRRSSNQGDCTQPCRWEYRLVESTRPDDPFIMEEDERYTYLLSSKDLCMIEFLPEIIEAGVSSLKIEGRMKSSYYVAVVTRTYRWAIDAYLKNPLNYQCQSEWQEELRKISYRGYTTGFYFETDKINEISPDTKYIQSYDLIGTVIGYAPEVKQIGVGVRNRIVAGDEVELLLANDTIPLNTHEMTDINGLAVKEAHNGYQVYFEVKQGIPAGAVLRRKL